MNSVVVASSKRITSQSCAWTPRRSTTRWRPSQAVDCAVARASRPTSVIGSNTNSSSKMVQLTSRFAFALASSAVCVYVCHVFVSSSLRRLVQSFCLVSTRLHDVRRRRSAFCFLRPDAVFVFSRATSTLSSTSPTHSHTHTPQRPSQPPHTLTKSFL